MIKVYNFILNIILTNENRKKLSMNKILRRMNSKTLNKIKKNLCEVQRNQKIIFFRVKSMRFSCAYLTFYIKSQFTIIILRFQVNITCRTGFLDQKFETLDIHMQVL